MKTKYFPGIGQSPYYQDIELGFFPAILETDNPELKKKKQEYIKDLTNY